MTAEEFRLAALELFGDERGWQRRTADALKTSEAAVSRYLSGTPIPGPVQVAIDCLIVADRRRKGRSIR